MATLSTLTIPQVLPSFPIRPPTPPTPYQQPAQQVSLEPARPAGVNPSSVLQHPGFYYYAAATCTQRRFEQFTTADQEFPATAANVPINLINERKVDHRIIILEVQGLFRAQPMLLIFLCSCILKHMSFLRSIVLVRVRAGLPFISRIV